MKKTYALVRADGSVAIMRMVDGADPNAEMSKWTAEQRSQFVRVEEVDPATLPKTRKDRSKWRYALGKVEEKKDDAGS